MMGDRGVLNRRQARLLVVIMPRALEAEAKTAAQDICILESIIRYANRRSLLPVKDFRLLAFWRIKIEIGFHTAGQHSHFRLTASPEGSQEALATLGVRLNEDPSPARTGRVGRILEAVKGEFAPPGRVGPFHPYTLGRNTQEIGAGERTCPFRIGERCAQARQLIAEDISRGALGNVLGKR